MSEESNGGAPEGREPRQANGGEGTLIGRTLREARQAANIDANKLCSDLRLTTQTLEALEQGNYHLLPGDPYIRALLGSIGRYLNLDANALIQSYNKEIGATQAAPAAVAPYKDRTQTHTTTHKQIFIGIFAVLFVILFLLFRKLNVEEGDPSKAIPQPAAGAADTLAPAAQDTLMESKSLAPDSSAVSRPLVPAPAGASPGAAPAPGVLPVPGPAGAGAGPVVPAGSASAGAAAPIDSSHLTLALVKPLIDSVGVKVLRSGKDDFATLLRLGKQMQVSHTDTIVILISKRKAVEVTLDGKTVIPDKRRFKIYGTTLKTF